MPIGTSLPDDTSGLDTSSVEFIADSFKLAWEYFKSLQGHPLIALIRDVDVNEGNPAMLIEKTKVTNIINRIKVETDKFSEQEIAASGGRILHTDRVFTIRTQPLHTDRVISDLEFKNIIYGANNSGTITLDVTKITYDSDTMLTLLDNNNPSLIEDTFIIIFSDANSYGMTSSNNGSVAGSRLSSTTIGSELITIPATAWNGTASVGDQITFSSVFVLFDIVGIEDDKIQASDGTVEYIIHGRMLQR